MFFFSLIIWIDTDINCFISGIFIGGWGHMTGNRNQKYYLILQGQRRGPRSRKWRVKSFWDSENCLNGVLIAKLFADIFKAH